MAKNCWPQQRLLISEFLFVHEQASSFRQALVGGGAEATNVGRIAVAFCMVTSSILAFFDAENPSAPFVPRRVLLSFRAWRFHFRERMRWQYLNCDGSARGLWEAHGYARSKNKKFSAAQEGDFCQGNSLEQTAPRVLRKTSRCKSFVKAVQIKPQRELTTSTLPGSRSKLLPLG